MSYKFLQTEKQRSLSININLVNYKTVLESMGNISVLHQGMLYFTREKTLSILLNELDQFVNYAQNIPKRIRQTQDRMDEKKAHKMEKAMTYRENIHYELVSF